MSNSRYFLSFVLAGILVSVLPAASPAAIVTYASRVAFDAAHPGETIQDFDSFSSGTVLEGLTIGGVTYDSSGGGTIVTDGFLPSTTPNGIGDLTFGFFTDTMSMTFTFSVPISSFGIDINTYAFALGSYTATTNLGDVALSVFDPFPGFSTGEFVGFDSTTPFSSVTIAATDGFPYTLDTLRFVAAGPAVVPEPCSLLMWSGILGAAGVFVRRKRKSA